MIQRVFPFCAVCVVVLLSTVEAAASELCVTEDAGRTQLSLCGGQPFRTTEAAVTDADIERLIQELISEDAKVAREARERLEAMHEAVVPDLFKKLVEADWDLKPPLLEVLTEHGRDYARLKLLHGTEAEKTYAALLYELIDQGEDTESREYAAMVEGLLKALKSEDKYLRAAAGLSLIYEEKSTLFFDHFHEIVPVLISSFDTDLFIFRGHRDNPFDAVFIGICMTLDAFIGDRLAYLDVQSALSNNARRKGVKRDLPPRRTIREVLAANQQEIEKLRAYWENWWDKHSKMSAVDIGRMIIERNLLLLEPKDPPYRSEHDSLGRWSLELWTGQSSTLVRGDWQSWWTKHKATYEGPSRPSKE